MFQRINETIENEMSIANRFNNNVFFKIFGDENKITHLIGDKINKGDLIGTVGSTGRSTGPHLDFRVNWFQTRLDPMSVIN